MPGVIGFSLNPPPPAPDGADFPVQGKPMGRPTNPLYFKLSHAKFKSVMSDIPEHRRESFFKQHARNR